MKKVKDAFEEINKGKIAKCPADGILVIILVPSALDQREEVKNDQSHAEGQGKDLVEKTVFLLSSLRTAKPNEIADGEKTSNQSQPVEDGFLPVFDNDDFEDIEDPQGDKNDREEKQLSAIDQFGFG